MTPETTTSNLHSDPMAARRPGMVERLFESVPCDVCVVDSCLRILHLNPAARSAFGEIPGGIIGRNFDEIMHVVWEKEYAAEIVRIFRRTLETGEAHAETERAGRRADRGEVEIYDWRVDRMELETGLVAVCYFRDVTESVRTRERLHEEEEASRRVRLEAEEASRAKDRFLATVSHELRYPLQGILGWVTLLKDGHLDKVGTTRALESVERSVRLQAQIVFDIMDVSRIAAGKLHLQCCAVDLAALTFATAEEFQPAAAAAGIELEFVPGSSAFVDADRERLHQVLANLIGNALKFTAAGGRVSLACRREGREVVVRVSDTGCGIEAAVLPKIFDAFAQSDNSGTGCRDGLGLGLAIVKQMVELHGGTVSVASEGRGCGSTFCVRIPAMRVAEQG